METDLSTGGKDKILVIIDGCKDFGHGYARGATCAVYYRIFILQYHFGIFSF
jgi:hypothetical protein